MTVSPLLQAICRRTRTAPEVAGSSPAMTPAMTIARCGLGASGSAVARRLVVLLVGDVLAPRGALALLAGFRQREVSKQPVGRGAVPMQRIGRDVDRIARTQYLRLLALETDAADAAEAIERLADRVRVPR